MWDQAPRASREAGQAAGPGRRTRGQRAGGGRGLARDRPPGPRRSSWPARGAALGVAGFCVAYSFWGEKVLSPEGTAAWLQVESLRLYLTRSDPDDDDLPTDRFGEYTAWAVALSATEEWARLASRITDTTRTPVQPVATDTTGVLDQFYWIRHANIGMALTTSCAATTLPAAGRVVGVVLGREQLQRRLPQQQFEQRRERLGRRWRRLAGEPLRRFRARRSRQGPRSGRRAGGGGAWPEQARDDGDPSASRHRRRDAGPGRRGRGGLDVPRCPCRRQRAGSRRCGWRQPSPTTAAPRWSRSSTTTSAPTVGTASSATSPNCAPTRRSRSTPPTRRDDVEISVLEGTTPQIRIGDPLKEVTGLDRYVIRYTLDGVVSDGDLAWDAVGTGWDVPIDDVEVYVLATATGEPGERSVRGRHVRIDELVHDLAGRGGAPRGHRHEPRRARRHHRLRRRRRHGPRSRSGAAVPPRYPGLQQHRPAPARRPGRSPHDSWWAWSPGGC